MPELLKIMQEKDNLKKDIFLVILSRKVSFYTPFGNFFGFFGIEGLQIFKKML